MAFPPPPPPLFVSPSQRSAAEAAHDQASERIKASQQRIREGIAAGREALAAEQARRREAVLGLKGSLAAVRAEVAAQVGGGGREAVHVCSLGPAGRDAGAMLSGSWWHCRRASSGVRAEAHTLLRM